jgi:hypothetical protein
MLELPAAQFDFLVKNVSRFVEYYKFLQYLYRDDIDKIVYIKFNPEDDNLFKKFLKNSSTFLIKNKFR